MVTLNSYDSLLKFGSVLLNQCKLFQIEIITFQKTRTDRRAWLEPFHLNNFELPPLEGIRLSYKKWCTPLLGSGLAMLEVYENCGKTVDFIYGCTHPARGKNFLQKKCSQKSPENLWIFLGFFCPPNDCPTIFPKDFCPTRTNYKLASEILVKIGSQNHR